MLAHEAATDRSVFGGAAAPRSATASQARQPQGSEPQRMRQAQATLPAASPVATSPRGAGSRGAAPPAAPAAVWSQLRGATASRSASASHTRRVISRQTWPGPALHIIWASGHLGVWACAKLPAAFWCAPGWKNGPLGPGEGMWRLACTWADSCSLDWWRDALSSLPPSAARSGGHSPARMRHTASDRIARRQCASSDRTASLPASLAGRRGAPAAARAPGRGSAAPGRPAARARQRAPRLPAPRAAPARAAAARGPCRCGRKAARAGPCAAGLGSTSVRDWEHGAHGGRRAVHRRLTRQAQFCTV